MLAPRSDRQGKDFWNNQAEILVAALMLIASNTEDKTMNDVLRWVVTRDKPAGKEQGEVAPLLRALRSTEEPNALLAADTARDLLKGIWAGDERTTTSIYATARGLVWPWADPAVMATAQTTNVDLDWLLSGANTLYISSPVTGQRPATNRSRHLGPAR